MRAQVLESLPPVRESPVEILAPGFNLTQPWAWLQVSGERASRWEISLSHSLFQISGHF